MSDLEPAGKHLEKMVAEFHSHRTLHFFHWPDGTCRIVLQQHKGQHFAKAPTRDFANYEMGRMRWGVLVEKLGRGLEVTEV